MTIWHSDNLLYRCTLLHLLNMDLNEHAQHFRIISIKGLHMGYVYSIISKTIGKYHHGVYSHEYLLTCYMYHYST